MEILNLFIEVVAPYMLEIIVVGALVEIAKRQWIVEFLHKNVRWWVTRLLPPLIGIVICLIWRLEDFNLKEYLKAVCICWAASSLAYNFLENALKGKRYEEENNNY